MWPVNLHTPIETHNLGSFIPFENFEKTFLKNEYSGTIKAENIGQDYILNIIANTGENVYFSVQYIGEGDIYTFSGQEHKERYIRQSPRDITDYVIDTEKEPIPMAAVLKNGIFTAVISDNPSHYENATTQHIYNGGFCIASGDRGSGASESGRHFEPLYHNAPHSFKVMLCQFAADGLIEFRNKIFSAIDRVWGEGGSPFHNICFASNYMHFRKKRNRLQRCMDCSRYRLLELSVSQRCLLAKLDFTERYGRTMLQSIISRTV